MRNGGVKRKGTRDQQRCVIFFLNPVFSNERCTYYKSAKYRTVKKSYVSLLIPCSLPFYTTIAHAFKSYIPPTFSERMFFISCVIESYGSNSHIGFVPYHEYHFKNASRISLTNREMDSVALYCY